MNIPNSYQNRILLSHSIVWNLFGDKLISACLDYEFCCITALFVIFWRQKSFRVSLELTCLHCAKKKKERVQSSFVASQHCLLSFWRQANFKISLVLGRAGARQSSTLGRLEYGGPPPHSRGGGLGAQENFSILDALKCILMHF